MDRLIHDSWAEVLAPHRELAQSLLSGLARCMSLQQALCCFWDEGSQSLTAAARYGGE